MSSNPVLKLDQVHFEYEKTEAILRNLSFEIGSNESVGIIGANGVGKSTLLKLLVGLLLPTKGTITITNISLTKKNLAKIREKIGYVFQDSNNQLFLSTVQEDVAFGPRNYGLTESAITTRVNTALEQVHISHLRSKPIYKLSGGEKKLAAIASILSMSPEILLMDEPSVALDPKNRRNLIHILNELPMTKLIASHDLDFIWDTCKKTILLSDGQIEAIGETKQILTDSTLLETYGLEVPLSLSR